MIIPLSILNRISMDVTMLSCVFTSFSLFIEKAIKEKKQCNRVYG